jgi:high affinity Mn2+ porin
MSLLIKMVSLVTCMSILGQELRAQADHPLFADSNWSFHFQFTSIVQGHPAFSAPYSGQNSLNSYGESDLSVSSTLFLGRKLWNGAALYFNPEMVGGRGVSTTLGVAGFPNGETYRIGDPEPVVYVGRFFLRQYIPLGKSAGAEQTDDVNQLKETLPASRLVLTLGKFSLVDLFDNNEVTHDPRSDFMNWALMANGAWDYAANTRGYTYALAVEWIRPGWTLRFATALEPQFSNGDTLDFNYLRSNSENLEWEKGFMLGGQKGKVRIMGYYNVNKAPDYDQVVAAKQNGTDTSMDVVHGTTYGHKKWGFGLNFEQELSRSVLGFARMSWNDGKTATWAFAEIDNTASAGLRIFGKSWHRDADNFGMAAVSNGISSGHRNFLSAGGYGFMIGDGKLPHYGRETILELFYETLLFRGLWGTLDYQFVDHPAYNPDRGPVSLFAARVHIEL